MDNQPAKFYARLEQKLAIFAKHLGWLHAIPEKKDKVRCSYFDKEDPYFVMPDLGCVDYIAELWFKCGRCKSGGMAQAPLDWIDVAALDRFRPLDYFEAEMIIMMSREYCSGLGMKQNSDHSPYKREYTQEEWLARERTIDAAFAAGEEKLKAP